MAEESTSGRGDTLYEEHEPTVQVSVTLPGVPRAAAATRPSEPARPDKPVFVSMKPPSEPGARRTPVVPAIDRPELRPRLRPMAESLQQAASQSSTSLGRYAPPSPEQGARAPRAGLWIYALLTAVAALAGAGITLWIRLAW